MKYKSNSTLQHSKHNKDWSCQYQDEGMERNDSAVTGGVLLLIKNLLWDLNHKLEQRLGLPSIMPSPDHTSVSSRPHQQGQPGAVCNHIPDGENIPLDFWTIMFPPDSGLSRFSLLQVGDKRVHDPIPKYNTTTTNSTSWVLLPSTLFQFFLGENVLFWHYSFQ